MQPLYLFKMSTWACISRFGWDVVMEYLFVVNRRLLVRDQAAGQAAVSGSTMIKAYGLPL